MSICNCKNFFIDFIGIVLLKPYARKKVGLLNNSNNRHLVSLNYNNVLLVTLLIYWLINAKFNELKLYSTINLSNQSVNSPINESI